jgi:hypothetical protein
MGIEIQKNVVAKYVEYMFILILVDIVNQDLMKTAD